MDRDGTDPIQRCFDQSYARLVRQLYGVCGDRSEAEDVVAEAFVRAVAKRRTFERLDNPEAWLRTVAVNLARSRHRRKGLGERLMGRAEHSREEPRDATADRGDRVDVVAALQQLPREQREALALHYLADLPVAEVAEAVNAPVGTVKARLSRGRTALAGVMTTDEPDVGVDAPPYDDIERRGQRRRAVQQGAAAGAVGLAVVLVVVFAQTVVRSGGDAAPPPIAPSPTQKDDRAEGGDRVYDADAIVTHPEARLTSLKVDAETQAALAVWECDRACGDLRGTSGLRSRRPSPPRSSLLRTGSRARPCCLSRGAHRWWTAWATTTSSYVATAGWARSSRPTVTAGRSSRVTRVATGRRSSS